MRTWEVLATTIALVVSWSGCGGTRTVTEHEPVVPFTAAHGLRRSDKTALKPVLNNPAQRPDPETHQDCDEAAMGHACLATTTAPSDPNEFSQRNCDTNIVANTATSCSLAENAFYEYYESAQASEQPMMVHSPSTGKNYELFCSQEHDLIGCTGSPLSTGIYTSFPMKAIDEYTSAQADSYASKRDVGHPGITAAQRAEERVSAPIETSESEPEPAEGEEEQEEGSSSHAGDQSFCDTHECIGEYESEPGTVVQCADGTYSHAGGIQGACSHHGGER
jgi:hypothetical protein